jgi:hypothetical protein
MVKPRSRSVAPTEEEIERFGNQAEQPSRAVMNDVTHPRHKEPKVTGINLRMTATQQKLLQRAAAHEDISQQKVLERLIWPVLAEKYPPTSPGE